MLNLVLLGRVTITRPKADAFKRRFRPLALVTVPVTPDNTTAPAGLGGGTAIPSATTATISDTNKRPPRPDVRWAVTARLLSHEPHLGFVQGSRWNGGYSSVTRVM